MFSAAVPREPAAPAVAQPFVLLPPPAHPPAPASTDALPAPWLVGLVIAAAIARFAFLGRQSFWYDEAVSVQLGRHTLTELFSGRAMDLGNPPLFPALLHLWMKVFGAGDAAVRALPALLGLATVPLVYAVGRRVLGARAAFAGAALLALTPYHVQLAQETRAYTLLAFAGVASVAALQAALARPRLWRFWLMHALATGALLLTHYFGCFLVLAEAVFVLARHRRDGLRLGRAAAAFAAGAVPFLLWLPSLLAQLAVPGNLARSAASWRLHLLATPLVFGAGPTLVWKDLASAARLGLGLLAVAALAVAVACGVWRSRRAPGWLLLALWLALPVALPALVSLAGNPLYSSRYAILASVPFYLFAGAGLLALPRPAHLACVAAIALAMGASHATYLGRPGKADWRHATRFVEARARHGDVLVFEADFNGTAYAHYARAPIPSVRLMAPPACIPADRLLGVTAEGDEPTDVTERVRGHARAWLVLADATPEAARRVRGFFAGWHAAGTARFAGITLELYDRQNAHAAR